MAGIHTLLEALLENPIGTKIKVEEGVTNETEYHTLRTSLSRKWSEHREVIMAVAGDDDPLASCSLCGDYNREEKSAVFYLGKPRRKIAKSYSFSIIAAPEVGATDDSIPSAKEA